LDSTRAQIDIVHRRYGLSATGTRLSFHLKNYTYLDSSVQAEVPESVPFAAAAASRFRMQSEACSALSLIPGLTAGNSTCTYEEL
jgi:hypothetical protein